MTGKVYQVTGECAHVVTEHEGGVKAMTLLYKGAYLPANIEPARLKHLLDSRLVAEVGEVPLAPNASVEQDPAVGIPPAAEDPQQPDETPAEEPGPEPDPELEERRAAAREKLANIDGGVPNGRHSEDVLVEYLTTKGYDYDELIKQDKPELVEMTKRASQS